MNAVEIAGSPMITPGERESPDPEIVEAALVMLEAYGTLHRERLLDRFPGIRPAEAAPHK